jgi:hypothetical protein
MDRLRKKAEARSGRIVAPMAGAITHVPVAAVNASPAKAKRYGAKPDVN